MNSKTDRDGRRRWTVRIPLLLSLLCTLGGAALLGSAIASPRTAAPPKYFTKNIEDVKVGDWVLAKNPGDDGPPTPHRVTALPRNYTLQVVHVQVEGGGELQATRNHPFFVDGVGWVDARDLKVGDRLRDDHDLVVRIARLWTESRHARTYNLTVDGVHTYYVLAGQTPVLVHNLDPWQFGDYNVLKGQSQVGDGLALHHFPQGQPAGEVIPGYNYDNGLVVAIPQDQHSKMNGTNYKAGEFQGSAADLLDENAQNMQEYTTIPPDKLNALNNEARSRYLPNACD